MQALTPKEAEEEREFDEGLDRVLKERRAQIAEIERQREDRSRNSRAVLMAGLGIVALLGASLTVAAVRWIGGAR